MSSPLWTCLMLLVLGLFFGGLGGLVLHKTWRNWRDGEAVGSVQHPIRARADQQPGTFSLILALNAFGGVSMLAMGLLCAGLAVLYSGMAILSAASGVPL